MDEEWRPVVGFEGFYEVSNLGNVRRVGKSRFLATRRRPKADVLRVNVSASGRRSEQIVHRMVLDAFVGVWTRNRRYTWVDGDRANNALANLEQVRGQRCSDCGVLLDEQNGYRHERGGLRSKCRRCTEIRRRRTHDQSEDAKRKDMPTECEICGSEETTTRNGRVRRPALDHCHRSGRQRGILCSRCNTGLGMFRDDPELLRMAAAYLDKHREHVA